MPHLIVPVIIAGILTKLTKSQKQTLSLKGVIEVKHLIENRIRVFIPSLKGDTQAIEMLLSEVKKIDVVSNITASAITGSVIVSYDQSQIEPVLMLGILVRLLRLDQYLEKKEKGILEKEFTAVTESFDRALLSVTKGKIDTKSAITALLVAGIAYSLYKNIRSLAAFPTPLTLLWWLYQNNLINKEEQ